MIQNYFSRLGSSIGGVFFGLAILLLSGWLLFWNEGKAVRVTQGLNEISKKIEEISPNSIDPKYDKQPIYLSGDLTATQPITDNKFDIETNDLKLKRQVETYQWQENIESKEKKMSDGSTKKIDVVTYEKIWSEELIDSTSFEQPEEHKNPTEIPLKKFETTATEIKLGMHTLSQGLIQQLSTYTPLQIEDDNSAIASVAASLQKTHTVADNVVTFSNISTENNNSQIGSIRITFTKVSPHKVSIIAQQIGETFEPYKTKSGESIEILSSGTNSDINIISNQQSANKSRTWMFRVLGVIGLFAGFSLILKPLSALIDFIPLLNVVAKTGVSLVAAVLSIATATITIGISWFAHRPLLSGLVVIIAISGTILFFKQKKDS